MTHKLVVAKATRNAITETDPNQLNFSSDYNTLKYHISGSSSLSGTWSTAVGDSPKIYTNTVAHNLKYVPFFICCVNFSTNGSGYNIIPHYSGGLTTGFQLYSAWVDANNIYFDVQLLAGATNSKTWNYDATFYYKIFRNRIF